VSLWRHNAQYLPTRFSSRVSVVCCLWHAVDPCSVCFYNCCQSFETKGQVACQRQHTTLTWRKSWRKVTSVMPPKEHPPSSVRPSIWAVSSFMRSSQRAPQVQILPSRRLDGRQCDSMTVVRTRRHRDGCRIWRTTYTLSALHLIGSCCIELDDLSQIISYEEIHPIW